MATPETPIRVGLSACLMHADPTRKLIFNGKPLIYAEQSMAHMVLRAGGIPFIIPTRPADSRIPSAEAIIEEIDALIMVGGVDMAPESYGEKPLKPEWSGDAVRDRYEIELVHAAIRLDRPLLGICRGQQVLNVALGGTLYQDINTQVPGSLVHRNAEIYDANAHEVAIEPSSDLARIYAAAQTRRINTVHHQAIKDLGKGLVVEARCPDDQVIEAVRLQDPRLYVRGVQWHPEFTPPASTDLLPAEPLIEDLLKAARERKNRRA